MNYYEHHIGDYAEATAHLSFVEDAAYSRLIRKYYAQEKPLPADVKAVQRLIAARSKEEREAVVTVLEEFFELRDDGWHQDRCDAEIARYQDKQAKAKASADARWNKAKPQTERNANASPNAMRTHSVGNAHQTPDTKHQETHTDAAAPKKYSMRQDLLDRGIPEQLANDWLECRKAKKLANTITAMEGVLAEVEKAGIGLDAALKTCCERGWGGFKAKWLTNDPNTLGVPVWEQ